MKCPVCNQPMRAVHERETTNPKDDKKYEYVLYNCEKDDTWITYEKPKSS